LEGGEKGYLNGLAVKNKKLLISEILKVSSQILFLTYTQLIYFPKPRHCICRIYLILM